METLLNVKDLKKYFPITKGFLKNHVGDIKAVNGVSFEIFEGETLGLVGESGSGKTTVGRALIKLNSSTGGGIEYKGVNIENMNKKEFRPYRRKMQMIFQDPFESLNPRMNIGQIISEPFEVHGIENRKGRIELVKELLNNVGLEQEFYSRYPHEFSGGQRQRVGIARAIALKPELVICDEPIASLDVSVQAQVVNLLIELQEKYNLTYLFISHDLSMVKYICKRVAVMYLGKIVELAETKELYDNYKHPYTEALLSAIPIPDPDYESNRKRIILKGDIPSPENPPEGCCFNTRCPYATEICFNEAPKYKEISNNHFCACHKI